MKKIIYLSILLTLLIPFYHAFAKDTDIYVLDQSMTQIPPDALIVLDLSLTMDFPPPGGKLYSSYSFGCTSQDGPFYADSGTGHTYSCTWDSPSAASSPYWGDSESCSGPFYRTKGTKTLGNFNTNCRRLEIAKRAIFKFLDADGNLVIREDPPNGYTDESTLKMRMGYMRFEASCSGITQPVGTHYSVLYCGDATSCTKSSSGGGINRESVGTYTALVDALSKTKTYYDGTKSGDPARDCRQKFAMLVTDGEDSVACGGPVTPPSTNDYARRREFVAKAKALADAGYLVFVVGFGGDMPHYLKNALNWAAYYGKTDNPFVPNSITSKYTIAAGANHLYPTDIENLTKKIPGTTCKQSSTYSCSDTTDGPAHWYAAKSSTDHSVFHDPGEMGISGYAFLATDATQLESAIDAIRTYIITYNNTSTSYVAPVVPISQMERTSSGNRMYLGMFKPTNKSFWEGNIKKYGIATAITQTLQIGEIIDSQTPPQPVMDTSNKINDTAKSYWSSAADGGDVDKGGVGELLLARNPDTRNIYTYMGTNPDLTHSSNAFSLSNTYPENGSGKITTTTLGVATTTDRDAIINFVHGWNPYNEITTRTDGKRDWILGAFIHARPTVVHYSDRSVIYAGANDGMLHAFDDDTGEELWAFIPPSLLPNLKTFKDGQIIEFFVDGSPKVYEGSDGKILVFGLRRGGNRYISLNIDTPTSPVFKWEISPSTTGYGELGQTWSTPKIGKIKNGAVEKWVMFIGGGYDPKQDTNPNPPDTMGTAIYVVDIETGNQIWKYSKNTNSAMQYSIPSDIAAVDTNGDGYIDRLYVGDMGGQIWRFDIGDLSEKDDPTKWKGKIIFTASGKIFYPPEVSLERDTGGNYEMLFFGTGDRENPKNTTSTNTLYGFKDRNGSDLTGSDLANLTGYSVLSGEQNNLNINGWYVTLENSGEKCLASAVIFGGAVYYTTYTPPAGSAQDPDYPCKIGEGVGRMYILDYQTAYAAFDLDTETVGITKEDRSIGIGSGIPSGVIISIVGGSAVAYAGVGGGVYSPDLTTGKTIIPMNWRIVF